MVCVEEGHVVRIGKRVNISYWPKTHSEWLFDFMRSQASIRVCQTMNTGVRDRVEGDRFGVLIEGPGVWYVWCEVRRAVWGYSRENR